MNAELRYAVEAVERSLDANYGPGAPVHVHMECIAKALRDQEAEIARLRGVADLVPSNWCDPLLTGPTAVIGGPPYGCPEIERLLSGIRARITAHLGGENNG